MSRSCLHSHRCAFVMTIVMFMTMFIVIMMSIVSANQPNTRRPRDHHSPAALLRRSKLHEQHREV